MLIDSRMNRGFSLVEVMVVITLMVILVMLAMPSLGIYTENSKIRSVAEAFASSAQKARTEAIRTNQAVQLILTTDSPVIANVGTSNLSSTAGNWIVRSVSDDATPVYTFIEGKDAREGSGRSDASTSVSISGVSNSAATSAITFNSAGSTSLGAKWLVDFTSSSAACTPVRCLRVIITSSGQVKMCEPAATAANDTRAC
jgi:type IV fimbrial biogenesis protein FimT